MTGKLTACEVCRAALAERGQRPDCTGCPESPPPLTRGQELLLRLYQQLAPGLSDGWGNLHLAGWESGLKLYGIPETCWTPLTRDLLFLWGELRRDE